MAGTTGSTSASLNAELFEKPERFSLLQVIRLLERKTGKSLEAGLNIQIRPELTQENREGDVSKVQRKGNEKYQVLTSILGLYGVSSPLPAWYTEDLISAEQEDKKAARALLDVIHQRLYTLFFRGAGKYNVLTNLVEKESSDHADILFQLIGIGRNASRRALKDPFQILRYINLFRQQPHSAAGLTSLLEDVLPGVKVEVEQCVERMVAIPRYQTSALSLQSNQLGIDTTLGEEIEDCNGKMLIKIGPISLEQFHQLLNGDQECRMMIFLIETYIDVPLECDIEFILEKDAAKTCVLGDDFLSCLGKNTWLFSGDDPGSLKAKMSLGFIKDSVNCN